MTTFARGQKSKLVDIGCSGSFPIVLTIATAGMEVDVSCFGLDANDKVSDDRYMVFFNQKSCPGGGVTLEIQAERSAFKIDVALLPESIHKLVFTASITGAGVMRSIGGSQLHIGDSSFPFSGADFQDEKAIIVGEVYKRDGQWRFGAVGQGFNGGLSALLKHFGGTETPASSQIEPPAKKVSLSKVTLAKRGDKVSLEKISNAGFGRISVNLNWNQLSRPVEQKKPGFLDKMLGANRTKQSGGIDLDLGCMFELADGRKGIVQALGESWGSFNHPPFVHLESDDRSGSNTNGENIFINGDQLTQIKRLLIFTFIYDGAANWALTNGVVTIETPGQSPIEVRLDNGTDASMCAIAMIDNNEGKLQVTKVVEYFQGTTTKMGHELINERFGFGLQFRAGSKD